MKKILVLISILLLIGILVISCLFMLKEKNKINSINKDIDNYKIEIDNLNKEINEFDSKLEQVSNEYKDKVDENKMKLYEVWENQNKYLDESL